MEICVWTSDQPRSTDAAQDAKRYKAGDVIVVKPDGWPWSKKEREHPNWRIVCVSDLGSAEAATLIASEIPTQLAPNRMLQRRRCRIDLSRLNTADTISRAFLVSCLVLKPPLDDPRIIGPQGGVIG